MSEPDGSEPYPIPPEYVPPAEAGYGPEDWAPTHAEVQEAAVFNLPKAESWMARAACRGMDPDIFHPGPKDNLGNDAAKSVCRHCPVLTPCLEYALRTNEREGVWGGTDERERRRLRVSRGRSRG